MKTDLSEQINNCNAELADIRKKIESLQPLDKLKQYLTQYALIKACGTVELVYRSIVADYFEQFSIPQIDEYLESQVRSGSMSATYDNMCGLLGKFDKTWQERFKFFAKNREDYEKLKLSASSLVQNRHSFAHGKGTNATFNDICGYYEDLKVLVDLFDKAVNGD